MTSAPGEPVGTLWRRPLVLISVVLYGLGLMVLLSPVVTGVPHEGDLGSGSRSCGTTLFQAFVVEGPQSDGLNRDRALDCTAGARERVGHGVLLLLLAVPVGAAALLTEVRASRPR